MFKKINTTSQYINPSSNPVTVEMLKNDPEVKAFIERSDKTLDIIGYTDHGWNHILRVSGRASAIVRRLNHSERIVKLAGIAGLLHDIGNSVHRDSHAYTGAVIAHTILNRIGMPYEDVVEVMAAIGSHDDENGGPVSIPSAALIIADKSDVLRDRVRPDMDIKADIHDRVNYAAKKSQIYVDSARKKIKLSLTIDVNVCPIMEYFEIFLSRMLMCKRSANFLGCEFKLVINKTRLL